MFTNGEIIYQWITYADADQTAGYVGAVGCKIEVGDFTKTKADQWDTVVNMASNSTDVAGKKWYK